MGSDYEFVEASSARSIQVGIRLDPRMTSMLSDVRDWLAEKPLVEYDGASGSGAEVAKTDTSLAGFLLKAAIENLYADRLIDLLIDEAAAIWSEEYMPSEFEIADPINSEYVRWQLKEKFPEANGISADVLSQLIEQGRLRYKSEGVKKNAGMVAGTHIRDRFNKRFESRRLPEDPTTLESETHSKNVIPF